MLLFFFSFAKKDETCFFLFCFAKKEKKEEKEEKQEGQRQENN
jgi:phage-related protein